MAAEPVQAGGNGSREETPHVTAGSVWRAAREQGFVKQLPSGNWARLRPVSLDVLLLNGEIPDLLTPLVTKMLFDGADSAPLEQFLKPSGNENERPLGQLANMMQLMNAVCAAALLEPCIVASPQADNEIAIEDLDLTDRGFIFQIAMQPVEVLRRFRVEQSADVASVPDGEDTQPAAQPSRRNKRRVGSPATG